MLICSNCWQRQCVCNKHQYVEIDDEMVDIICDLNRKGYKTCNCCAGHLIKCMHSFLHTYIQFNSVISFDEIPNGFECERQELMDGSYVSLINRSIPVKYIDKDGFVGEFSNDILNTTQLEVDRKEHLSILKTWVEKLPYFKEGE